MLRKNYLYDKTMNKAIEYLSLAIHNSGHNSKPVILHSIRVGFYLYEQNYSEKVIVSAILHDLLEDTDTTKLDIENDFGTEIAEIVQATSFNTSITDKTAQYKDMFFRCLEQGHDALIIKAADILDNSNYIELVNDLDSKTWLIKKLKFFLDLSQPHIGNEKVWTDLLLSYNYLVKIYNFK